MEQSQAEQTHALQRQASSNNNFEQQPWGILERTGRSEASLSGAFVRSGNCLQRLCSLCSICAIRNAEFRASLTAIEIDKFISKTKSSELGWPSGQTLS